MPANERSAATTRPATEPSDNFAPEAWKDAMKARLAGLEAQPDQRLREAETRQAEQEKVIRLKQLALSLGARYAPARVSLDRFEFYDPKQRGVIDRLRRIISRMPAEVPNLVLLGTVGTGKDHLLAAILYAACERGLTCRWLSGQEFFGSLRDRMDQQQSEREFFEKLLMPQILAISDPVPPAGDLSSWNTACLCRLLDMRYRELKQTWVTVNALSAEDADGKLSAQVWDRLQHEAEILSCFWSSFRERKATGQKVG